MKEEHIISILESSPFNSLGESEMAAIDAHVAHCEGCRRALEAAQISALLIRERAVAGVEPPPFFQTRVMAALRERRASAESPLSSLRRLWKATGALVSGMAATVVALAVLTFVAPSTETVSQDAASAFNAYAAEDVILASDRLPEDGLSYDQVLNTIYETDEDAEK